jgi:hypothetical protein
MRMELNTEFLIELEAPADSRLDQAIPGAKWSATRNLWLLPTSWAACTVSREVLGNSLEVGPQLAAWSADEYERRVLPASVARESTDGPPWEPATAGDPSDSLDEHGDVELDAPLEDPSEAWWWDIWRGMPEYLHKDLSPYKQVIVSFRSSADFEAFAAAIGQRMSPRCRSIWFPEAEILHEIDWRYSDAEDLPTDAPNRPGQVRRAAKANKSKTAASDAFTAVLENLA